MIDFIANCFGHLMNLIYCICNNYGITIFIFTFITRIVLFPVGILVHKNSIKMVKMKPKIDELKLKYSDDKDAFMEAQIDLFEKEKYHPSLGTIPLIIQIPIILGLVYVVKNPTQYIESLNSIYILFINLSIRPSVNDFYIIPAIAVVTTILLWLIENKISVLQKETSLLNKIFTGVVTIGITTYLVFLVPNGVGLYWVFGDIFAVIQILILNTIFPPKKYVDYEYLNKIRKQKEEQIKFNKESKRKSKYYYKKFFETDNIDNMKFVIYAEGKGYYKYFKSIVEYILENSNITIHYITGDMNDPILVNENPKIKSYYIATNQLIPLFMKIEADIVLMTTPDLGNFYLKRSIVRNDVEYIYTSHGFGSANLTLRTGAFDNYDTVFTIGEWHKQELLAIENLRSTKKKKMIECGSPILDYMLSNYKSVKKNDKYVLIAPSWQKDNLMDYCLEDLLDNCLGNGYKVILRPHPQYVRHYNDKIDLLREKYNEQDRKDFEIQTDFSSTDTVYNADVLITDWSGIAFEYALTTLRPVLYINTPMKIMNPEYKKIDLEPMDIYIRNQIGIAVDVKDLNEIDERIKKLFSDKNFKKNIEKVRNDIVYNLGKSAEIAGNYIISRIENKEK